MLDQAMVGRLFDAAWYMAAYPDVVGEDPLTHFRRIGAAQGRDPNPMFSTAWYLDRYKDVAESALNALEDYVSRGAAMGRDPGPLFSTRWYLASNPDVAAAGLNPLEHYLAYGADQLRDPSPVFDSAWYFSLHPDAAARGVDARIHYMRHGAQLGHDPCALFSTRWYLERYPEVAASGENPLLHYLTKGAARTFDPSPHFSTSDYLASHPDVAASGENPLLHYLRSRHSNTNHTASSSSALSLAAVAEVRAVINALGPIEPDLAELPHALSAIPSLPIAPDRVALAWRGLYLSIYELPRRLVLVGSIDAAPELARWVGPATDLLIVETDAGVVSLAESLPRGVQWRSVSEFGTQLDREGRVTVVTALVNGLQPAALLVWGSRAGWEMLGRHGAAIRRNTALFAAATGLQDVSASGLLRGYFRACIPVLSALYGPDVRELQRIAAQFGLPPSEHGKLRETRDLREPGGFLATCEAAS